MLTVLFTILALAAGVGGWGIVEWAIAVCVIVTVVAIAYAVCRYMGVTIPPVIVWIFWAVVICCVAIAAIRFVASM